MLRSFALAVFSALLLAGAPATGEGQPLPGPAIQWQPTGRIEHAELNECSGLVQSQQYPGLFWAHNDSGDQARLFTLDARGQSVVPGETPTAPHEKPRKGYSGLGIDNAANNDWEDITLDGETIYIADVGNNLNARRDLGLYVLIEPNPGSVRRARSVSWLPIVYPDQKEFAGKNLEFDCEAVFVFDHKVYFLTKHRMALVGEAPGTATKLYRLDTKYTDRPNVLTLIERRELGGWVTAADLSPDGKTLAVLTHTPLSAIWLFEKPADSDRFLSGKARMSLLTGARQCEALAWIDDKTLLVGNEQGELMQIPTARIGSGK